VSREVTDPSLDLSEPHLAVPPSATSRNKPESDLPFSYGAAGFTFWWLLFHGKWWVALLLIPVIIFPRIVASLGPGMSFLAALIGLAVSIGFGFAGSGMAVAHRGYRSVEELNRGERAWTIIGSIGLVLQILWALAAAFN
jgi:hypothetical protein